MGMSDISEGVSEFRVFSTDGFPPADKECKEVRRGSLLFAGLAGKDNFAAFREVLEI